MSKCADDAPIRDDFSREVYCVLGMPIDAVTMTNVLSRIDAAAGNRLPYLISTPNLNFLVNSLTNHEFKESLLLSDLCPADGMPIVWIARLLGAPIKERIAGSDIFAALKSRVRPVALKIFLFGSTEAVAAEACQRLNFEPRGLKCVGWLCPGFGSVDELSQETILEKINASGADFLMAALGAKNGQLWLLQNHARLRIPVRAHLGATINFQAGTVKRAPRTVRRLGFEWLWRIKEEPNLFARYGHDGAVLLRLLLTHILPLLIYARWFQFLDRYSRHDFAVVRKECANNDELYLSGYATARRAPQVITAFREAVASQKSVLVDLSQIKGLDARIFGLLLMLRKQLIGQGLALKFQGASPKLQRQFRLNEVGFLLSVG